MSNNFNANSVVNFNRINAQKAIEYFLHNTWYVNDDQVAALILAELGDDYNVDNISARTYHKINQANNRLGLSLAPFVSNDINRFLAESQMTYEELDDILEEIGEEERRYDSEFDNAEEFTEWRNRICMFKENAHKEADMSREELEDKIRSLLTVLIDFNQDEAWWQTWIHIKRDLKFIYSRMTPEEIKEEIKKEKNNIKTHDRWERAFSTMKIRFIESFNKE